MITTRNNGLAQREVREIILFYNDEFYIIHIYIPTIYLRDVISCNAILRSVFSELNEYPYFGNIYRDKIT